MNARKPAAAKLFGRPSPAKPDGIPVIITRTINGVRHCEPMLFWRRG